MTVADYDSSPPERFVSSRAFERCGNFRTPNGLPLTGGHRTPKRTALDMNARRWTSGAAAELGVYSRDSSLGISSCGMVTRRDRGVP
jgi:hypothetical protein